jgi:uncharacterized membrane protein YgcG
MNWRNPFLVAYLSVTVAGTAILGYLVYSSWTNAQQVDADYIDAVGKLQKLQNRAPFPNDENNAKYVEYTKQYQAEFKKLRDKAESMQKPLGENVKPQDFQEQLIAAVIQVKQAAKENNVTLPDDFYLGFDQYRGTLPADPAAAPLARELAAIRLIVDQLIQLKVREITGIKRELLPEEGGRQATAAAAPAGNNNRGNNRSGGGNNRSGGGGNRMGGGGGSMRDVVVSNNFELNFVADQAATRAALNGIAGSDQFFIIRYLNIANSATEGPLRGGNGEIPPPPSADPNAPKGLTVLVGREMLSVSLRIEMITFNNLPNSN